MPGVDLIKRFSLSLNATENKLECLYMASVWMLIYYNMRGGWKRDKHFYSISLYKRKMFYKTDAWWQSYKNFSLSQNATENKLKCLFLASARILIYYNTRCGLKRDKHFYSKGFYKKKMFNKIDAWCRSYKTFFSLSLS